MSPLPEPVRLDDVSATGEITPHGAHVLSWVPDGGAEVIFLSRDAVYDSSTAIRGGIPVIFPWFGPGRTPGMAPFHGFARTAAWHQEGIEEGPDGSTISFSLTGEDASSQWFPHAFKATLVASFGVQLRVTLEVTNTGTEPFSYEDALHAYFRVGDVEGVRIEGLDGATYVDKTRDGALGQQHGDLVLTGETDRIYASPADVRIVDPALKRTIHIAKTGSADTVVWNPWADKAKGIADLGDDEWKSFVCVEAANTQQRAVELAPGASHRLGITVSLGD